MIINFTLFLNVYMPKELSSDNVEFIFTINGIDYKVSPVNYDGPGAKIFRYSQGKAYLNTLHY